MPCDSATFHGHQAIHIQEHERDQRTAGHGPGALSQDRDVQQWLSHEVMLIGWGDFRSGDVHYDIVSSLPGMRSHDWTPAAVAPLIGYMRDCWVAAQQTPCQLDVQGCADLLRNAGEVSVPDAITTMKTALVHGINGGKHGGERVFAALSREPSRPPGAGTALKLLLPFIDTALRRMPPAPVRQASCARVDVRRHAARVAALS
jgi:hypothetical protein